MRALELAGFQYLLKALHYDSLPFSFYRTNITDIFMCNYR
jgi:hypothetical protein